jgi:hypothetical protein
VYVQHVVIPSTIADDLRASKDKILNFLANITDDEVDDSPVATKAIAFNLSRILSVSNRLSQYFPELKLERKLVQSRILEPPDLSKDEISINIITRILVGLLHSPMIIQDYVVKVTNTIM